MPAAVESDTFAPAITGVLSPGPSAAMTAAVLEVALLAKLRGEARLAYACDVAVQDIARDAALISCVCDAPPADAHRALALMRETIARIADDGPTAEELDRARAALPSPLDHRAMVHWAIEQAERGLCRGPDALHGWTLDAHLAVDGDEIRAHAAALRETALFLGPADSTPQDVPPLPGPESDPLPGERFRRRRLPHNATADTAITIGQDGACAEDIDGELRTIRTANAAVLVEEIGGGIAILGVDGNVITVDPRDLRDGEAAVAAVRQAFGETPLVPLAGEERAIQEATDGVVTVASAEHLEFLPSLLEAGEQVQHVEEATLKLSSGALVLTDRRLLFLGGVKNTAVHEWARADIGSVRARRPVPGWNYLHVELAGETRKFGFTSRARLTRARDALAGGASTPAS